MSEIETSAVILIHLDDNRICGQALYQESMIKHIFLEVSLAYKYNMTQHGKVQFVLVYCNPSIGEIMIRQD